MLNDIVIGIPPLSHDQARKMLGRLRGFRVLAGVHGKPPADVDAICRALVGLSRLAVSLGDRLVALDINPLTVLSEGKGAIAVDALVRSNDVICSTQ